MDDSEKLSLLSAGFGELLRSGLFSDLKIVCSDGSTHEVHKKILCAQSRLFKNALNPQSNFLEAKTSVMKLEHDDPLAVKALLEYYYCCNYTNIEGNPSKLFGFHVSIYTIGEKYFAQGLKRLSVSRIGDVCCNAMDLKQLDFPSMVKAIYRNTVASDDVLRRVVVVDFANESFDRLVSTEGFAEMMDVVDQFSTDLGSLMLKQRRTPSNFVRYQGSAKDWKEREKKPWQSLPKYSCRDCVEILSMELLSGGSTDCILCGASSSESQWQACELDVAKKTGSGSKG